MKRLILALFFVISASAPALCQAGYLACLGSSGAQVCGANTTQAVGVFATTLGQVIMVGEAPVNLASASSTMTGDYACSTSVVGTIVDNGTTACPSGQQIGFIAETNASTVSSVNVFLHFNGGGSGSGGLFSSFQFSTNTPITVSGTYFQLLNGSGINQSYSGSGTSSSPYIGTLSLASPTLSSLGGVEAINAVSSEWINSISTSGVPSLSQPGFSDLSGNPTASQLASSPASGDCLGYNGSVLEWIACGSGGMVYPSGSGIPQVTSGTSWGTTLAETNGDMIYGSGGSWTVGSAPVIGASGVLGSLGFGNATSGIVTLETVTGALGTVTASLPANSGTIAETNLAQTWSALQTFGTDISIAGVTVAGAQGSGDIVFASSPTLTTPNIGAATGSSLSLSAVDPSLTLDGDTSAGEGPIIYFQRGGTTAGEMGTQSVVVGGSNNNLAIQAASGNGIYFYTNASTAASVDITSAGQLGIVDGALLSNSEYLNFANSSGDADSKLEEGPEGYINWYLGTTNGWILYSNAGADLFDYNYSETNAFNFQEPVDISSSLSAIGSGTIAATTATNLASYPTLCSGGQFSQGLSSGSNNCATPTGGGNVSTSGSPAEYETAVFASGTSITGVGPGTSGYPLVSGGSSTNPSFAQLTSAGLNITATSCSDQVVTAISAEAVGTCAALTTAYLPALFQTNSTNNTTDTSLNMETSTTNAVGLTVTPTNSATNVEKFEVTGGSYTGNSATATAFASTPSQCTSGEFATGIAASGNANCSTPIVASPEYELAYYSASGTASTLTGSSTVMLDNGAGLEVGYPLTGSGTAPSLLVNPTLDTTGNPDVVAINPSVTEVGTGAYLLDLYASSTRVWSVNFSGDVVGAAAKYGSVTDTGLTSGDCVQATTGGLLETTGSACGSGSAGVSSLTGDGNIITNSASTGAVTLTIAGTSGGIPYFSSASAWKSSAVLPSGDFVLGGGAGDAPTASFSVVPIANGGTGLTSVTAIECLAGNSGGTGYTFVTCGLPTNWSQNGTTGTVTASATASQNAQTLAVVPGESYGSGLTDDVFQVYNLASPTLVPICSQAASTSGCVFAVGANGNLFMTGNGLQLGVLNQSTASNIILPGGTSLASFVEFNSPALGVPSAPSATAASGGSLPASTTYQIVFTYLNGAGETTVGTSQTLTETPSTCTTSGDCEFTGSSPSASSPANATDYKVYARVSGGSTWEYQLEEPIGTGFTFSSYNADSTQPPTGNGTAGAYNTFLSMLSEGGGVLCASSSTPGADCAGGTEIPFISSTAPTSGHCAEWASSTTLEDSGASCGSGGSGVSSVGLSLPSFFTVTGSPVTTSGTLTGSYATGLTSDEGYLLGVNSSGAAGLYANTTYSLPTYTGSITTGHCVEWASATSLEDAGAACGSGMTYPSGSGIAVVSSGDSWGTTLTEANGEMIYGSSGSWTVGAAPTVGVQDTTQGIYTAAGSASNPGELVLNISGATADASTIKPGANTAAETFTLPTASGTFAISITTPSWLSPAATSAAGVIAISAATGLTSNEGDLVGVNSSGAAGLYAPSTLSLPLISGTPTTGDCVEWASASSIESTGSACGSGSSITWDAIGSPENNQTLNMAAYTTTWNSSLTSALLTIQQSTAATSSANVDSPAIAIGGTYWTGSASANNTWTIQDQPSSTGSEPNDNLMFTQSGSTGTPSITTNGGIHSTAATGYTGHPFLYSIGGTEKFEVDDAGNVYSVPLTSGDCIEATTGGELVSTSGACGTVTSIGVTPPSIFSVTPSSITTSGTFAWSYATGLTSNENQVLSVNASGAVGLNQLTPAMVAASPVSGDCAYDNSGTMGWTTCGSSGSTSWSSLTAPTAALTLNMGADATIFESSLTSALLTLEQTTAATSNTSVDSPAIALGANVFTTESCADDWMIQNTPATGSDNPQAILTISDSSCSSNTQPSVDFQGAIEVLPGSGFTSGSLIYVNAPSGFGGNLLYLLNNSAAKFFVDSTGDVNQEGNLKFLSDNDHIQQNAASSDIAGTITVTTSETSASKTFGAAYTDAPACTLTPTSNPGSLTWWVTTSTTAVTANVSAEPGTSVTFDYVCMGNPD